MPIVLCRVDERLIHGQVVLGWGGHVRPNRYVVVDDEISRAEWEQELYQLALPAGPTSGGPAVTVEFASREAARKRLHGWVTDPRRTVLLVRNLETILELARGDGLRDHVVNLGGLHYAPGRKELLPYLHLDEADVERVRWLDQAGITVQAQDLPAAPILGAADLIRKSRRLWSG